MSNELTNEELVNELFSRLHRGSSERELTEAICLKLRLEHPTIQQNFFRLVSEVSRDYAFNGGGSDLRNEGSKALATHVANSAIALPYV